MNHVHNSQCLYLCFGVAQKRIQKSHIKLEPMKKNEGDERKRESNRKQNHNTNERNYQFSVRALVTHRGHGLDSIIWKRIDRTKIILNSIEYQIGLKPSENEGEEWWTKKWPQIQNKSIPFWNFAMNIRRRSMKYVHIMWKKKTEKLRRTNHRVSNWIDNRIVSLKLEFFNLTIFIVPG